MTMPTPLPYGMRDNKVYPYTDGAGSILATEGYDLPYMQTFSFAEAEEYTELRGDDKLVATHGNGAQVNWSLEAGGIDLTIWSVLSGGQIIETGATPFRDITLRKLSDDQRPYFRMNGDIVSDSGGNVEAVVYRGKCNGDISGQFGDGQFFVTSADGVGLPMLGTNLLYDIVQHETRIPLSTTPSANPAVAPTGIWYDNLTATGVDLHWDAVPGAVTYKVEKSDDDGDTWSSAGTDPSDPELAVTTLTTATAYLFHIATTDSNGTGFFGKPFGPITTL